MNLLLCQKCLKHVEYSSLDSDSSKSNPNKLNDSSEFVDGKFVVSSLLFDY